MTVDPTLLRFQLPDLILAQTGGNADPQTQNASAQVTGLHPLLSVAISLSFRPNTALGGFGLGPTDATWSISALARNRGNRQLIALTGTQLVTNNLLPDGFETASAAFGLQIDAVLKVDANGDYGDWVLNVEACPVDADLVLKCPDVLRDLYSKLKSEALQPVGFLINSLA